MIYLFAAVVIAFLAYMYVTEQRNRAERRELYQRIQAPQQAVSQAAVAQAADPGSTYVAPDDDEAWEKYMDELRSI
jgi:hypothetical protein